MRGIHRLRRQPEPRRRRSIVDQLFIEAAILPVPVRVLQARDLAHLRDGVFRSPLQQIVRVVRLRWCTGTWHCSAGHRYVILIGLQEYRGHRQSVEFGPQPTDDLQPGAPTLRSASGFRAMKVLPVLVAPPPEPGDDVLHRRIIAPVTPRSAGWRHVHGSEERGILIAVLDPTAHGARVLRPPGAPGRVRMARGPRWGPPWRPALPP